MQEKLTDAFLRALEPPSEGRIEIVDLGCIGLAFRITKAGGRSWCFRFRDPATGATGRSKIGNYPDISLKDARATANDMRARVAKGVNPATQKKQDREAARDRTVEMLAKLYLAEIKDENSDRFKRSADQDEHALNRHVLPKWETRRYDEINRADVIELTKGIMASGTPIAANRVQALISGMFGFAVDSDLLVHNPCARLKKQGREQAGTRVLSDVELRLFWPRIIQSPLTLRTGQGLRLALLLGCRIGEVTGARRDEFSYLEDTERAGWLIPGKRTKNGRAHFVPLPPVARSIVLSLLELVPADRQFLFPARSNPDIVRPAHGFTVAMRRFGENLPDELDGAASWHNEPPTAHDLRRTLRTRLSMLGVPKEDRDAILNHTPQDVGSKHYDVYDRAKEKRQALTLWNDALGAVLSNGGGS
jgi:integrase